jgi:endonuclease/exonuclease/phosphatase family metal-dependent hydrolase
MRLASYNVENLFLRARALNGSTWAEGQAILEAHAKINQIFGKAVYSAADKTAIVALLKQLGLAKADESAFAILRQNRGRLLKRPKSGPLQVVAAGRSDWIGWVELVLEEVDEIATRNTAQVIRDVNADVLGVVEAESRPALLRFSENLLPAAKASPYGHIMLIDGNDDRGIDVGIMTRQEYEIVSIVSHVDDKDADGLIFSRDCAQYEIRTKNKNRLFVLLNHLKSKGYGSQATSNAKRLRQAKRVKEIYTALRASGADYVAILGDFNDTPDSAPLAPLFKQSDLKDISEHGGFDDGGRPGTFGNGAKSGKIDYILMSPALFGKVKGGGIFRKGVWGGTNGTLFPHYAEITKPSQAASDHAAIWAEVDL